MCVGHASQVLAEKVYSLHPIVEEWNGELTETETDLLTGYCTGQYSDGYGEGFEQRPIKVEDGEIYVRFWNSDNFFIKPEQSLKQNDAPDVGFGISTIGGM